MKANFQDFRFLTFLKNFIRHPQVKWAALGIASFWGVWVIGGNVTASFAEKEIQDDINRFAEQFPKRESNQTTQDLRVLIAKLGIDWYSWRGYEPEVPVAEGDRQAFEQISEPLAEYLNSQFSKATVDEIDPLPPEIQAYLTKHQATIEAIQELIRRQGPPVIKQDITPIIEGDLAIPLPLLLGMVELQRVLSTDVLDKQRQGQPQSALETLEVTWTLNHALADHPAILPQLVWQINQRIINRTLRSLPQVPSSWQERLSDKNVRQGLITALEGEGVLIFSSIHNTPSKGFLEFHNANPNPIEEPISRLGLGWLFAPLLQPYIRWSAIDSYQTFNENLREFEARSINFCESNENDLKINRMPAFWNILGQVSIPTSSNLFLRTDQIRLSNELTQKILELRQLAAKSNAWPATIPPLESQVCPGFKWVYQKVDNDTVSLTFTPEPSWYQQDLKEKRILPLNVVLSKY